MEFIRLNKLLSLMVFHDIILLLRSSGMEQQFGRLPFDKRATKKPNIKKLYRVPLFDKCVSLDHDIS
jgi:hypothetical protein